MERDHKKFTVFYFKHFPKRTLWFVHNILKDKPIYWVFITSFKLLSDKEEKNLWAKEEPSTEEKETIICSLQ